jgi:hypothetical protein
MGGEFTALGRCLTVVLDDVDLIAEVFTWVVSTKRLDERHVAVLAVIRRAPQPRMDDGVR